MMPCRPSDLFISYNYVLLVVLQYQHPIMKVYLVTLLLFVASAFAQTIRIDEPTSGQTLKRGGIFTAKLTLLVGDQPAFPIYAF